MNSTYQLYEPRRTERALCADFPADEVLIRGLKMLYMQQLRHGSTLEIPIMRVMNTAHYMAVYLLNMPCKTQEEYDLMIYERMDYNSHLLSITLMVLLAMLRHIGSPRAKKCVAMMNDDRADDFYEGLSLYEQWLKGAELYYREEDFLIDVMDEVNILRMQNQELTKLYNRLLNEKTKMDKEMNEQKLVAPIINNYGSYVASQTINNDIHDNNNCKIYACNAKDEEQVEQMDRVVENAPIAGEAEDLFMYIHHDVVDEMERLKVHKKIKNIVRLPKVQLICDNLKELMTSGEIYKTIKPDAMLKELRRLGMPNDTVEGFSDGNFFTYYKNIF